MVGRASRKSPRCCRRPTVTGYTLGVAQDVGWLYEHVPNGERRRERARGQEDGSRQVGTARISTTSCIVMHDVDLISHTAEASEAITGPARHTDDLLSLSLTSRKPSKCTGHRLGDCRPADLSVARAQERTGRGQEEMELAQRPTAAQAGFMRAARRGQSRGPYFPGSDRRGPRRRPSPFDSRY